MIDLIENNRDAIADLCRQYGVQRLAVFGSAVNGAFDPETSDIDFVMEFTDYGPGVSSRFLRFYVELERLVGRPIDVVADHPQLSDWFHEELDRTAVTIYEENLSPTIA